MSHFELEGSIGFLVNRTAVYLRRELQEAFRKNGFAVTAEQWAVINRLWEQEGQSQVQLAERTFKDKPNVSRMIEVLEKNGLVYRRQNKVDRRAYQVYLTDVGRELRENTVPLAVEVLDRALSGLGAHDVEHFKRILAHIDSNLEQAPETMNSGSAH